MINHFFNEILQNANTRIIPTRGSNKIVLDKNEQSTDVESSLKQRVLDSLMKANWNRYPAADYKDIETKIAEYCGLTPEHIVLSAGSASIITTLLDYFSLNQKQIVIAQPSYSLFDYHCKTYNIPYTPWHLTDNLEFDYENMPELNEQSVLIITSPNNPTGNTIDLDRLEWLLSSYPQSCIILDAVYSEFNNYDVTPLVDKYQNLIVLRSFSKAFPIAGLRLGYLCANPSMASIIKKLILQFSITHFSLIFAKEMLFDIEFMQNSKNRVREIVQERDALKVRIEDRFDQEMVKVFPSQGNFLLIRIFEDELFAKVLKTLNDFGIKVLNTSNFSKLNNTIRVSIGTPDENEEFYTCFCQSLSYRMIEKSLGYQEEMLQAV